MRPRWDYLEACGGSAAQLSSRCLKQRCLFKSSAFSAGFFLLLPPIMTARRQASTTSLSKYLRDASPGPTDRSLDFCNAFWGLGDGGVDVLFARMRGASRTMTELRAYWKERCAILKSWPSWIWYTKWSLHRSLIEEDYAKRMSKLSKVPLGKDEIGYVQIMSI